MIECFEVKQTRTWLIIRQRVTRTQSSMTAIDKLLVKSLFMTTG
jgi:hypothetical protein